MVEGTLVISKEVIEYLEGNWGVENSKKKEFELFLPTEESVKIVIDPCTSVMKASLYDGNRLLLEHNIQVEKDCLGVLCFKLPLRKYEIKIVTEV
ncbi:hypothetical protein [Bacillus bombysepticus]|uniref:hypothetical protein n=1 Tax=Bacillus bombysepticus TaxID=658666 RepID=UPI003015F726